MTTLNEYIANNFKSNAQVQNSSVHNQLELTDPLGDNEREILFKKAANYDLSSFKGKKILNYELRHGDSFTKDDFVKKLKRGSEFNYRSHEFVDILDIDSNDFVKNFHMKYEELIKTTNYLSNEQMEQLFDILDINEDGILSNVESHLFSGLDFMRKGICRFDSTDLERLIQGSERYKTENEKNTNNKGFESILKKLFLPLFFCPNYNSLISH